MARTRDSDGEWVTAGDKVEFSYGAPAVGATAEIIERDGKLFALTPKHTPKECSIKTLRKHVGEFWKINT